jgi:hypothetical protein
MGTSRRTFLKLGGLAALAVAAGGGIYKLKHGGAPTARFVLDGEARSALHALVPALLGSALPTDTTRTAAIGACTERVHGAILGLPLSAQKEIQDLFGLLALGPARRFLAGVPGNWADATPEQLSAFLQDWRTHRFEMLQTAYHALHDLVIGSWYADPSTWAAIGYPGPLKELA